VKQENANLAMIYSKRKKVFIFALIIFALVLSGIFTVIDRYAYYQSPNGKYSLSVYRIPMLISSIGGGSDAPGIIILSNQFGIPVKACGVDIVQSVSSPKWNTDSVYMKLILDWKLK
jgi:hypothetical protein